MATTKATIPSVNELRAARIDSTLEAYARAVKATNSLETATDFRSDGPRPRSRTCWQTPCTTAVSGGLTSSRCSPRRACTSPAK